MDYIDHIIEYKGYPFHNFISRCGIQVRETEDGKYLVIATDLGDDTGTSVTNACETIAEVVCRDYEILPRNLIFIEHYPARGRKKSSFFREETFNIVQFKNNGLKFFSPEWKHLPKEKFIKIISLSAIYN